MDGKTEKNARTSSRKIFNSAEKAINDSILKKETSVAVLNALLSRATSAFETVVKNNDALINVLDEKSPDYKKASEEYVEDLSEKYQSLLISHARYVESITKSTTQTTSTFPGHTSSVNNPSSCPVPPQSIVRRKTIEVKPFTNQVRDYLPWKKRFVQHFKGQYGDSAGIILKDALHGEAATIVRAIDDSDVDQILSALDKRYGQEDKLINTVTDDLEKMPMCSPSDAVSLRRVLDTIELARNDLAFANLEVEIEHYSTVKLIERKFSDSMKIEWAKCKAEHRNPTASMLFPIIIEFLKNMTLQAEDVQSMGSTSTSSETPSRVLSQQDHPGSTNSQTTPLPLPQPIPPDSHSCSPLPCCSMSHHACQCLAFQSKRPDGGMSRDGKKPGDDGSDKGQGDGQLKFCTVHKAEGTHWSRNCRMFKNKTTDEKIAWFKSNTNCCRICLNTGHGFDGSKCTLASRFRPCNKDGCTKKHLQDHHDALVKLSGSSSTAYINQTVAVHSQSIPSSTPDSKSDARFKCSVSPAQAVEVLNPNLECHPASILLDTGSVITLIHSKLVQQAQLVPATNEKYHVVLETVGGDIREHDALAYRITLKGKLGTTTITALAVDNIGSPFPTIDMSTACKELRTDESEISYPSRSSLDILVGMDNAHLFMTTLETKGSLILARNVLGKLIYGAHDSFKKDAKPNHYRVTCYGLASPSITDLFATDILGVECTPKCGSCRCGKCAPGSGTLSLKEEREYKIIRAGMKLEDGIVIASYPWIRDHRFLPNNYELALKRLVQLEKRLQKDQDSRQKYSEQIEDMVKRKVARKLSREEDAAWRSNSENPVQYLPHHDVLKPGSTTPVRIVFDPSSRHKGHAVNEYWGTGPNLVLNSLGLQIRFRENQTAVVADISKMYNTVHITPREAHCHRFLWRDMQSNRQPDIYIIERNSFGSRPAAAVAIAALHLVAETGEAEFPIGSRTIKQQSYVDDIVDSTTDKKAAGELIRQTDACLALGSFKTKGWTIVDARDVMSSNSSSPVPDSSPDLRVIGGNDETVLGLRWDIKTDSFFFIAKLNFSKRKKGLRSGPNLKKDEVLTITTKMTLRGILSQVNGYYDPMGLIGPYIVELKFSLGKLWKTMKSVNSKNDIWDVPIPDDHDLHWRKLFNSIYAFEEIKFPRHLKPDNTVGEPWLILFSDSSMMSFGAVAYIRWTLKTGGFWCRLIASKSRIWPTEIGDRLSICRGELQGALLAKRLAKTVTTESRFKFETVKFLIDSDIVRAQIADDGNQYDIFTGNRIGEIRASTTPDQWYHIAGDVNVCADLLSRGSTDAASMNESSDWQRGPPILYLKFSEWPVSQKYVSEEPLLGARDMSVRQRTMTLQTVSHDVITDWPWTEVVTAYSTNVNPPKPKVVKTVFSDDMETKICERIKIENIGKLNVLLAVTYRLFHALAWKRGDGHFVRYMSRIRVVDADQLQLALEFWIRQAQRKLRQKIKEGHFKRLNPALDENSRIWRLNGRFGTNPRGYHPILLPSDHEFVKLLVTSIHRRSHGGATATAAKVKDQYHVIGIKNLAKQIRKSCIICRKLTKKLLKAPMAPLPIERIRPAFPFEHCSCDLFGNFLLKVPGRVTRGRAAQCYGKGKGLIITCLSTRAIHLEAMEGEDTSAFLLAFRRFISVRGQPRYMWSDNGGQIVAAETELKDIIAGWNDQELKEFGAYNGLRWQYIAPGSPWMNGVSESLIRSVKRSLATVWQSKPRIPIMELQTVLYEISALLNERPINLGHAEVPDDWDSDTNLYLCPNQLLLGRSTVRIPGGPFGVSASTHAEQFHNVEVIATEWWEHWTKYYLPTLLPQSKWHSKDRTVKIGDICYVKDTNPVRGNWQIAEVIRADPSSDGTVRQVELRYKNLPDQPLDTYSGVPDKTEIRDVKNLVIILTSEERNKG